MLRIQIPVCAGDEVARDNSLTWKRGACDMWLSDGITSEVSQSVARNPISDIRAVPEGRQFRVELPYLCEAPYL